MVVAKSLASSDSRTCLGMLALRLLAIQAETGPVSAVDQHSYPDPATARLGCLLAVVAISSMRAAPVSWKCHIHGNASLRRRHPGL